MISKRHIKAFIIALSSFKFPVSWGRGRRKRCRFTNFNKFEHPVIFRLFSALDKFGVFDIRISQKGDVEIWFRERERDAVNKRRFRRRIKHILSQNRSYP
jgi:hypothetical protein